MGAYLNGRKEMRADLNENEDLEIKQYTNATGEDETFQLIVVPLDSLAAFLDMVRKAAAEEGP